MAVTIMQQESTTTLRDVVTSSEERIAPQPLVQADCAEVLEFLAARPIHTVFMASLISDNGMASPTNRGSFYGCRNSKGKLDGVALIGHATLVETESADCIQAFADLAKDCSTLHVIRGEREIVSEFWSQFAQGQRPARLLCRELLLELKKTPTDTEPVAGLRQATMSDLEMIMNVNASMAADDNGGVNPLTRDPEGFRARTARRIRKGRIWVWTKGQRLLFKTDVIGETPQASYLEGVYVDPGHRGKGYGFRCISQLASLLLARTDSVCLTVNEKSSQALTFYQRAGYEVASRYDTIYLP
jgi:uncharacterized protein